MNSIQRTRKLGQYDSDVKAALSNFKEADVVRRVWKKDYTVWKSDPVEIINRLGWLTVTELMHEQVPIIQAFTREVQSEGFQHVVLLGMGGSSLGAEVLSLTFGNSPGFPQMIVLDSTVPDAIQSVTSKIVPPKTLFLVSSKSGTTTEPMLLFRYFKNLVEQTKGKEAGRNFAAITDAGTPLVTLGQQEGFRKIFFNPPDIGGRYSVLSYFGLVPAALMGIDIKSLLERADNMRESCASCVPIESNPGCWLGACIGALSLKGKDKLTFVTSPAISSFGLWVEQLIAESTGKDGKGIIPVSGEPLVSPIYYGNDRLFVYLRLKDDDNTTTDSSVNAIKASGQPVVILEMRDKYDLGTEFFRWEFATAIAGSLLGIHPFNQPDVQLSKEATGKLLNEYIESRRLPKSIPTGSLNNLLAGVASGKYLAIMAYINQTTDTDAVLTELRRRVIEKYHIATTLGYGPRFLHSTGQLHKGGPDKGLFLQITTDHEHDISIPGEPYTFGIVVDAQALGDRQALQASGRQVVNIHLPQGDATLLTNLVNGVASTGVQ